MASSIQELLFGQQPGDVEITDPELVRARDTRSTLQNLLLGGLTGGGPSAGASAVLQAGEQQAEQARQRAAGATAGLRGMQRIAGNAAQNRMQAQATQETLARSRVQAGQQQAIDQARAIQQLLGIGDADIQQWQLEQGLREQRKKPGILAPLAMGFGSLVGAGVGGPAGAMEGAQLGGQVGSGIQRLGYAFGG